MRYGMYDIRKSNRQYLWRGVNPSICFKKRINGGWIDATIGEEFFRLYHLFGSMNFDEIEFNENKNK